MRFEEKVLQYIEHTESIMGTARELSSTRQRVSTVLNKAKYLLKRTCFLCERKFSPYAGQLLCTKCSPRYIKHLSILRMILKQSPALCVKFFRQALDGEVSIKRKVKKIA